MKAIVRPNNTGKTRELIEYSLQTGIPIYAYSDSKARSLREKALAYFGASVNIVTSADLASGASYGDILVDDMEKVFVKLLSTYLPTADFNLVGFTATED